MKVIKKVKVKVCIFKLARRTIGDIFRCFFFCGGAGWAEQSDS